MEEIVEESLNITAEEAVKNMSDAKASCNVQNGVCEATIAKQYIEMISNYSKYCIEEAKEDWIISIKNRMCCVGDKNYPDADIIYDLKTYEYAGQVMEYMANGKSWEEIDEYIKLVAPASCYVSSIGQLLLKYSSNGVGFIDNVIGSHIKTFRLLNAQYNEFKQKTNLL